MRKGSSDTWHRISSTYDISIEALHSLVPLGFSLNIIIFIYFYERMLTQGGLYMCTVKISYHLAYLFAPYPPKFEFGLSLTHSFLKNSIVNQLLSFHKFTRPYHLLHL